jgi:hypothetical protein
MKRKDANIIRCPIDGRVDWSPSEHEMSAQPRNFFPYELLKLGELRLALENLKALPLQNKKF